MKVVVSYLKENSNVYIIYLLFLGLTFLTLYLHDLSLRPFTDIFLFLTFVLAVYSMVRFYFYHQKIKELQRFTEREMTSQIRQFLPKASSGSEDLYQQLVLKAIQQKEEQQQQIHFNKEEILEDFGLWLHQIKTPIAGLDLLVQSPEPDPVKMKSELFKINEYLQMMLNYLRQNLDHEDLVIEKVSLESVVKVVLRKYAIFFSQKNLRLVLKSLNVQVYTDRKWLTFILEQLIFNAVKYTSDGEIALFWEPDQLVIADTGIGIRPEDLPRVFEKGYTGYNGREQQRASGLGLYLCQMVASKIGIQMRIGSILGKGTRVYLTFPKEQNFYE
ncbi:ATP-binding protein [Enterococcus olivae]